MNDCPQSQGQQQQRMTMMTQQKKKDKSDVDPLYERRRWRRRSTADFRHAAGTPAPNVATRASRSERQLPIIVSDSSEDSSSQQTHHKTRINGNGNGHGNNVNAKGSIKPRPSTRFRRTASRSFRGIWQGGIDGAYDASCLLAPHLLQQMLASPQKDCVSAAAAAAGVVSRFAMRRHAVMEGIRERIAGLRLRAETAPGRLEWEG
jgi:hypothetical protein